MPQQRSSSINSQWKPFYPGSVYERIYIANKRTGPITSLRSDTSMRRTDMLASPHLSGSVFHSLSICLPHGLLFLYSLWNGDGGRDPSYGRRLSQFIVAPRFRLHQTYSLATTNRNPKPEDDVPDYKRPAMMTGSRVQAILFCLDQKS